MAFEPKKVIPPIAAAGLTLAGCGDSPSDLQQASDRIADLDPPVTAFCMKWVECYPDDWLVGDLDGCRALFLSYGDIYVELSDPSDACRGAFLSYFDCFGQAPCETWEADCSAETAALETECSVFEEEEAP